jgi:16S rRNA (guanine527-N7)-methyltransferase
MNALWKQIASALDEERYALLNRYLDLLLEANKTMNLTRIVDRASAELLHIADSLTLLPYLPATPHRLADIGSGGGVPGIPLAIVRPDADVTLIESTRKKGGFLEQAIKSLGLTNAKVIADRAETIAHGPLREGFDIVTARAVGWLDFLVEWCLPLVKKGGRILAMKGARIAEELPAAQRPIRLLGGGEPIVHEVKLPGTANHVIVEIAKLGKTNAKYPRPPSEAKGKPL